MNPTHPIETSALTKRFGTTLALDGVDWRLPAGASVGLVGRNGSGKSTLLQLAAGFLVPTPGACRTLGRDAHELGEAELARVGFVDQEARLLDWLTVEQHVRYVAAFQPRWDADLERRLRRELELDDPRPRVGALSAGMRQRLALLLAVCHRPTLLLLDEPVAALDPLARRDALRAILDRVIDDGASVVVSSHVLHDVEKVVDRVLCLERGRVAADAALDDLKERYVEWIVTSSDRDLPATFPEPYVLAREGNGRRVRLAVLVGAEDVAVFRARHRVEVEPRSLDLEQLFPLLTRTPE
jgi:ABC-2 type transport system ATP-binding protein